MRQRLFSPVHRPPYQYVVPSKRRHITTAVHMTSCKMPKEGVAGSDGSTDWSSHVHTYGGYHSRVPFPPPTPPPKWKGLM